MKIGDYVQTPRFLGVTIKYVFEKECDAIAAGFKEPTYYDGNPEWDVLGKVLDMYHMQFAAVRK